MSAQQAVRWIGNAQLGSIDEQLKSNNKKRQQILLVTKRGNNNQHTPTISRISRKYFLFLRKVYVYHLFICDSPTDLEPRLANSFTLHMGTQSPQSIQRWNRCGTKATPTLKTLKKPRQDNTIIPHQINFFVITLAVQWRLGVTVNFRKSTVFGPPTSRFNS